jgi:hypothetical protein
MAEVVYDLIAIGGGLGGAALGPIQLDHRDIFARMDLPFLAFPHATMQEVVLAAIRSSRGSDLQGQRNLRQGDPGDIG